MARDDIRFSNKPATIEHDSARGKVFRNSTNFTRGSQLFSHEVWMTWAGIKVPLFTWIAISCLLLVAISFIQFREYEIQLVLMKLLAELWNWVNLNPDKIVNLTLPDGSVKRGMMAWVPDHPAVEAAWGTATRILWASLIGAVFICGPLTIWFVEYSRERGSHILKERHERGALLVSRERLVEAIQHFNAQKLAEDCGAKDPPINPGIAARMKTVQRIKAGLNSPYKLATVPYPWRLEQSHAMFIGTTGAGKTTELKKLVTQARVRGHRCVIFDLTGSFVESFYNPDTDVILNTMDQRCQPWSIFNDCENYAEFLSAATALVPSGHNAEDDFWQKAARMLFVEMCMKLKEMGVTSNGALAHYLMKADLKSISRQLESTMAAPLVATQAAKMAESIRATFNTHANALRFLPDPKPGEEGFSINSWMTEDVREGSILFITSTHPDLVLNRPLLTLWMDIAVNALFKMGRTRDMRTWFLLDEVHALHRLPAIEHGLQTARAVGGAFVLGIHSFDKLAEIYGENGAVNLASLARTKLILSTADMETAEKCADFIGNREVRQMDEAYSYGYNSTRDASTITPRKEVQHLVMPDDIKELPSLHGYVKFPEGFPAAKIKLTWRDYKQVAEGFVRVKTMRAAEFTPPDDDDDGSDEMGEDGRESDGPANDPEQVLEEGEKTSQERAADLMAQMFTEPDYQALAKSNPVLSKLSADVRSSAHALDGERGEPQKITQNGSAKPSKNGESARGKMGGLDTPTDRQRKADRAKVEDDREKQRSSENPQKADDTTKPIVKRAARDDQESEAARESRFGYGAEGQMRDERNAGDDFGMEM